MFFLASATKYGVMQVGSYSAILHTSLIVALFIMIFQLAGVRQFRKPGQITLQDLWVLKVMVIRYLCKKIFQILIDIQLIGL